MKKIAVSLSINSTNYCIKQASLQNTCKNISEFYKPKIPPPLFISTGKPACTCTHKTFNANNKYMHYISDLERVLIRHVYFKPYFTMFPCCCKRSCCGQRARTSSSSDSRSLYLATMCDTLAWNSQLDMLPPRADGSWPKFMVMAILY